MRSVPTTEVGTASCCKYICNSNFYLLYTFNLVSHTLNPSFLLVFSWADHCHFLGVYMFSYVRYDPHTNLVRKITFCSSSSFRVLFSLNCAKLNTEGIREAVLEWCIRGWNLEKNSPNNSSFSCNNDSSSIVGWACRGAWYRASNVTLM